MTVRIPTLTTVVPSVTDEGLQRQVCKLAKRDVYLSELRRNGRALTRTYAITVTNFATFVVTLTRPT